MNAAKAREMAVTCRELADSERANHDCRAEADRLDRTAFAFDRLAELRQLGNDEATFDEVRESVERELGTLRDDCGMNGWHRLHRIDLGPIVRGESPATVPGVVHRDDGVGILYPGALHDFHGEPGSGKSWFVLHAGAETIKAGSAFAMLDYEGNPHTFVERMRALGIDDDMLCDPNRVAYHNLIGKTSAATVTGLVDEFTQMGVTLVALDAMLPALVRNGLDDNSNADVATFHEHVTRPLTRSGAAVGCVDHMTKDVGTRARGSRGAGAKLQLVDVSYSAKLVQPFSRDRAGSLRITCAKDRFGTFSIGETVADVEITPEMGGRIVDIALRLPEQRAETFRPTVLMERVSEALVAHGPLSLNGIKAAIRGDDKAKALATEILVNEGFVHRERAGQSYLHTSARPFPPTEVPR